MHMHTLYSLASLGQCLMHQLCMTPQLSNSFFDIAQTMDKPTEFDEVRVSFMTRQTYFLLAINII